MVGGLPTFVGPLAQHGIGGARDLPIPREMAITAAVAALIVSFVVLAWAWRTPRFHEETSGRPAPEWLNTLVSSAVWRWGWRAVGLLLFGFTAMVAIAGKDLITNPIFGIFYVWWWVGLVPASLLCGPVWRTISPVRTLNSALARLNGNDPEQGLYRYPAWLGHWPAVLGLFAFVWMELVYPNSVDLGPVRLWCAIYVAAMILGGTLWGNTFFTQADPFEVYSTLMGKLSVWGMREGQVVIRNPLANVDTAVATPGLAAVLSVLFGSTAFDSFKDSVTWVKFVQSNHLVINGVGPTWANFIALTGMCLLVGLIFTAATRAPNRFAHSLVPIVAGYIVAHYLSYFVEAGQGTLIKVSDPFSTGANWFGTADWKVNYYFAYHPTLLAVIKVCAVVAGHILGVISAHDRSLKELPASHQIKGQLPLLVAMIGFTATGLYLLFSS